MDNAGETRSDARVASEGPALREHRDREGSPTGVCRDRVASEGPRPTMKKRLLGPSDLNVYSTRRREEC